MRITCVYNTNNKASKIRIFSSIGLENQHLQLIRPQYYLITVITYLGTFGSQHSGGTNNNNNNSSSNNNNNGPSGGGRPPVKTNYPTILSGCVEGQEKGDANTSVVGKIPDPKAGIQSEP